MAVGRCDLGSPRVRARLLSGGATLAVLGYGAGWHEREYRAYGIPFPRIGERIEQLDEAVEIIRRMWTDATPTFAGRTRINRNS